MSDAYPFHAIGQYLVPPFWPTDFFYLSTLQNRVVYGGWPLARENSPVLDSPWPRAVQLNVVLTRLLSFADSTDPRFYIRLLLLAGFDFWSFNLRDPLEILFAAVYSRYSARGHRSLYHFPLVAANRLHNSMFVATMVYAPHMMALCHLYIQLLLPLLVITCLPCLFCLVSGGV